MVPFLGSMLLMGCMVFLLVSGPTSSADQKPDDRDNLVAGSVAASALSPAAEAIEEEREGKQEAQAKQEVTTAKAWVIDDSCKLGTYIGCSCQKISDKFGAWHYHSFVSTPTEAEAWWQQHKCKSKPGEGTEGEREYTKYLQDKVNAIVAVLADWVERLRKHEPDGSRLKRNEELLEAVRKDIACFGQPAWPGIICGGSKDISARFKHFFRMKGGAPDKPGADDEAEGGEYVQGTE